MKDAMRKALMLAIAVGCLAMALVGAILPILPGWIFLIVALAIFAKQSTVARGWIRAARRRWPGLSRHVENASNHRRAPRALQEFARLTDPGL
jgi:uncharacterized membrane protein YbaN (DUF454 family)